MKLRILDKNNNELFVKQGLKIDCTYESEYSQEVKFIFRQITVISSKYSLTVH